MLTYLTREIRSGFLGKYPVNDYIITIPEDKQDEIEKSAMFRKGMIIHHSLSPTVGTDLRTEMLKQFQAPEQVEDPLAKIFTELELKRIAQYFTDEDYQIVKENVFAILGTKIISEDPPPQASASPVMPAIEELSIAKIKQILDAKHIVYPQKAKKEELYKLI